MENEKEKSIAQKKRLVIEMILEQEHNLRNSKYGKFIIQTNKVHFYLGLLILSRTVLDNKKLIEYLEGSTLGNLINCFRICARNSIDLSLVDSLELYNSKRNALAHKMYTEKELTETDCESSIKLGEQLLSKLKELRLIGK